MIPARAEKISSRVCLSVKKYTKQDIGESCKKIIERVIIGK